MAPVAFGWDEHWADAFERLAAPDSRPARVTAQHRDRWTIQIEDGAAAARIVGGSTGRARPVTGDWVVVRAGAEPLDPWEITAVLPRRTVVRRGGAGGSAAEQVLAANVDRLWIVEALDTAPNLRRLERYLSVAWESGAAPELILTKSDLAEDLAGAVSDVRAIAFGVPVWVVSVEDQPAIAALERTLAPGRTVALLGPSGAGKSTLINQLAHTQVATTGEVRAGDRKGRHTTTGRELFPIRGGALLLDTPGLRELRVLDVEEGLQQAFPEIDALAASCRYRDCSHTVEPGCAVLAAAAEGRLPAARLQSFQKLMAEAAYERRKADPVANAAHVAVYKTAMKTLKHHLKRQRREEQ